nr:unnamed protein product [Digitaria exilis]
MRGHGERIAEAVRDTAADAASRIPVYCVPLEIKSGLLLHGEVPGAGGGGRAREVEEEGGEGEREKEKR